jgi:hypothetical protein
MRQVTVAGLCGLLLITCVSCSSAERAVTDAGTAFQDAGHDAGTDTGARALDAETSMQIDASLDIQFLVIATVLEMERSLIARCPCLTAAGEYDSASECLSAVNFGRNWIDCANRVDLSAHDNDETREGLRCNIAELSLRSECLMGSSCAADAIAMCMTQSLQCTGLPYELISNVVSQCMITLSR